MRTKLIILAVIVAVFLIGALLVFLSQNANIGIDASIKLHPLQKWTDDLFIQFNEVPQGWVVDGLETQSEIGVATRWIYYKNPSAVDISFINFQEQFIPYSNTQVAADNYQKWVDNNIPPAYQDNWQLAPELDFDHYADQQKIKCLPGEVNFVSQRVCISIAQYQNLIVVASGIVYDKWLPASSFRLILQTMDHRIAKVLSTQSGISDITPAVNKDGLPFEMPTPDFWQGATRILLAATDCSKLPVEPSDLQDRMVGAVQVIKDRLKDAGVYWPFILIKDCQIEVDVPPVPDLQSLTNLIAQTGHFELVDNGPDYYPDGTVLRTTSSPSPTVPFSASLQSAVPDKVYKTIVTGANLDTNNLYVQLASDKSVQLSFALKGDAVQRFAEFTSIHNESVIGSAYYICIVFDNVVRSCPSVRSAILNGKGVVTVGDGGQDEANRLLKLFRSGALPVDLNVVKTSTIH